MGAHRPRRGTEEGGGGPGLTRSRVVRVQPDVPAIHRAFDYRLPEGLVRDDLVVAVGTIVRVPLHGRRVRGWIVDPDVAVPEAESLRDVLGVVSAGPPADVVELCRWAAWRWAGPWATFLRAASPPNVVRAGAAPERETAVYPGERLLGAELLVVGPRDDTRPPLAPEGSTLVIDPSAARAARLADAWRDEGREVLTLGSDLADAPRTRNWDLARAGACVVIGGRSAVWAPVPDLAAVVVLDEGDEALEDERAPTWNGRAVALERARRSGAAVRVITPAPTVDALVAVGESRREPSRRAWPRVEVVDQRDEEPGHGLLSAALADALRRTVGEDQRAVCVLNRRGRARLLACHTCKELARCETCGATVEQQEAGLVCARCATVRPLVCLHCHGSRFRAVRPGITRVRDDLAALLPRTEVAAVDGATDAMPDAPVLIGTEAVLHRVADRAGTPVGLVAFLELDQELLAPRAYAAEQAMWLLVRGARLLDRTRPLLLQTRLPDHEVVEAVVQGAPMLVAEAERSRRQTLGFPPFGGLAELRGAADAVTAACAAVREQGVTVLGPVPDGSQALLRAPSTDALCDALAAPGVEAARTRGRLRVDVDPRRV